METHVELLNKQFINQLQNAIGYLECEFLYLAKDVEQACDRVADENDLPSAKFALATYYVERASRIVHEQSVVDWLNSRLAIMNKQVLTTST